MTNKENFLPTGETESVKSGCPVDSNAADVAGTSYSGQDATSRVQLESKTTSAAIEDMPKNRPIKTLSGRKLAANRANANI
jgi:hypothetical protein